MPSAQRRRASDGHESTASSQPLGRRPGDLAGAIYGQIVVTATLALLRAEETLTPAATLLSIVATLLILWIAHVYSALIAERVREGRRPNAHDVAAAAAADWPLVQTAAPTAVALLLAVVGVWSRDTGVDVGLALGVLSLFGWGAVIGRRSSFTWPRTLLVALVHGILGLVIVLLELLVH